MKGYLIIVLVFFFALVIRLWNLNEMGRAWDEPGYIETGYKFLQLAYKGDFNNFYWYEFPDHPPLAKYLYGFASQFNYLTTVNGTASFTYDFTYARIVSAVAGSVATVFVLLIGWQYRLLVGLTAALIFALLPLSVGYSQLASLESIRLLFYTAGLYTFLLFLKNQSVKHIIITGIFLGCALSTKQTAILMYPLFIIIAFLFIKNKTINKHYLIAMSKKLLAIFGISFFTFFILWPTPWFHLDYVYNFTQNLWFSELGKTPIPEVFFGKLILVPKVYFEVYLLITTPILILILFGFGVVTSLRQKHWFLYSLLASFSITLLLSFYNLQQHGVRYILEIYVPLSLISAVGLVVILDKVIIKNYLKLFCLLILFIYLFIPLIKLSPYYLEYFNSLVGGTNNVYEKRLFQMGWWGQGLREAGLYIKEHAPAGSVVGLAVSPDHVLPRFNDFRYAPWEREKVYDYVIVNYYHIVRDKFDDSFIRKHYDLVYEVKADKAVLVSIYKKH